MLKKYIALILALLVLGSLFGCAPQKPAATTAPTLPPEASSKEIVKEIALALGEAVMCYDLKTLQKYSVFSPESQERILEGVLPRNDQGLITVDGETYASYAAFLESYDAQKEFRYDLLEIKATRISFLELEDAGEVLMQVNERENMGRTEADVEALLEEAIKLECRKVAMISLDVRYQPAGAETVNSSRIYVMLLWMDSGWKSYSPSVCGAFPMDSILERYFIKT